MSMVLVSAFLAMAVAQAQTPTGAIKVSLSSPVEVMLSSVPVQFRGDKLSIVNLGQAVFRFSEGPVNVFTPKDFSKPIGKNHLTVEVKASVLQYSDVDYGVSCAVFDKAGKLLGTASHIEKVQYIRLGNMPMMSRGIKMDFGSSKAFASVAYAVFSITEPDVPKPPDA